MSTLVKRFLLALPLVLVLVPVLQAKFRFFEEVGLEGAFTTAPRPELSWDNLRDNTYQPALEKYLEDHIGFRPYLIRARNQLAFSLFRVARSSEIIVGRNDVLFQPAHIAAYAGKDCLAEAEVRFRVRRLRAVQRVLSRRGIELLFVMAPNKARFQPEDIPAHLQPAPGAVTNYDLFMRAMQADTVALLNLVPVFAEWKKTKPYPLFPRAGTHWSGYGSTLAADTLLRRLEAIGRLRFPAVRPAGPPRIATTIDSLQATDNDIGSTLNLWRKVAPLPTAYPRLAFDPPQPGQTRPPALFVGDSFTWGLMLFSPFIQRLFADDTSIWYYGYSVFKPDVTYNNTGIVTTSLDWRKELESRRFIILLLTEHNLIEREFGFTDKVYRLYHPLSAADEAAIAQLAKQLSQAASWEEQSKEGFAQRMQDQARDAYERQQMR